MEKVFDFPKALKETIEGAIIKGIMDDAADEVAKNKSHKSQKKIGISCADFFRAAYSQSHRLHDRDEWKELDRETRNAAINYAGELLQEMEKELFGSESDFADADDPDYSSPAEDDGEDKPVCECGDWKFADANSTTSQNEVELEELGVPELHIHLHFE